jgi:hypothetical protein
MDNSAWIGLVGALGGILVTSLFGLVLAVLKHRWEAETHKQQRSHRLSESRAESRRTAYMRYLVATDEIAEYVLMQPAHEDGTPSTLDEVRERIRELRAGGDSHFSSYDAAFIEAQLLAGGEVVEALDAFDSWMSEQIVIALTTGSDASEGALVEVEQKRRPLLETMRAEQAADLSD